jgi:hypothetical protein
MAYFQTKNPDLGKFWRVLQEKMLVYHMAILQFFWCIVSHFGMLYQEKSGNPGWNFLSYF